MGSDITIRLMEPADLDTLRSICIEGYSQNFGHHWTEGGLADYLDKVFAASILAAELAEPQIRFYVAFRNTEAADRTKTTDTADGTKTTDSTDSAETNKTSKTTDTSETTKTSKTSETTKTTEAPKPATEAIAFMKLNLHSQLPGTQPEKGIELDKLYILPDARGQKIGARMMDLAFQLAETTGKDDFWVTVIDTNAPAIAFYEKYGFRFHSTTRVPYPKFRDELKGMWRMHAAIKKVTSGL